VRAYAQYPLTSGVCAAAICVTLWWWAEGDIDPFLMDTRAWHGQPWRLLVSALPHIDPIHLIFNVYWLWVFGTAVEPVLGRLRMGAMLVVAAAVSAAAEYAVFDGGVGLSGVGYGLFGFLLIVRRHDERFREVVDAQTIQLFVGWFLLCIALTWAGVWAVANVAHAAGAICGILLGYAHVSTGRRRHVLSSITAGVVLLCWAAATVGRPYVNLSGHNAEQLAYFGYKALEDGADALAARLLRDAVTLEPNDAACWYNLGVACLRLGRDAEAIEAYERARKLDPQHSDTEAEIAFCRKRLGYAAHMQGRLEEAVALYRQALSSDETDANTWFNLGTAYEGLGRVGAAEEAYARATAVNPANEEYRAAFDRVAGRSADE